MSLAQGSSHSLDSKLAAGLEVLAPAISCGFGHLRAAQAVADHLQLLRPDLRAAHHDLALEVPRWFRALYVGGYNLMVSRHPVLFGMLYDSSDVSDCPKPTFWQRRAYDLQTRALHHVLATLQQHPPRAIVHTHYLLPSTIWNRGRGRNPGFKQAVCVTDYEIHRYWRMDGIDQWFVVNDLCRETLSAMGIDRQLIEVTGIPLLPRWSEPSDPAAMRKELSLEAGRAVVLLSAGASFVSFGFERMIESCLKALPEAHCVVLVGRNRTLQSQMETLRTRYPLLRVMPFTERMPELMSVADVMVTKPGGLTTSEALTRGVPMLFINPVPGQEICNCEYLLTAGVAVRAYHPRTLPIHLHMLLSDKPRLHDMKERALALAKPHAGRRVAEWAAQACNR